MNPSAPVRVGMVGLGKHARDNLLPTFLLSGAHVAAISSRNHSLRTEISQRYSIPVATAKWQELIQEKQVDALVVSATPQVHEEAVLFCAQSSIPIFVEKPPAQNLASLRQICAALGTYGEQSTFVDFNFRFADGYVLLKSTIPHDDPPVSASIRFVSSKPRSPWLGFQSCLESLLFGVAIHAFDLALDICACDRVRSARMVEMSAGMLLVDVVLDSQSGRLVHLELGSYSNRFETSCRVITGAGKILYLSENSRLEIYSGVSGPGVGESEYARTLLEMKSSRGGYSRIGYSNAAASFLDIVTRQSASTSSIVRCMTIYALIEDVINLVTN